MSAILSQAERRAIIAPILKNVNEGNDTITLLGEGSYGKVYKIGDNIVKKINVYDYDDFKNEVRVWQDFTSNKSLKDFIPEYRGAIFNREIGVNSVARQNIEVGQGYIIQKYEPVETLLSLIDRYIIKKGYIFEKRYLNFDLGFSLFNNLIKGFSEIHKSGFIHRDIKEANILIRTTGKIDIPIIIDFGLVCQLPCDNSHHCDRNNPVGTSYYMVPNTLDKRYRSRAHTIKFPVSQKSLSYLNRFKKIFECGRKQPNNNVTVILKNDKLKAVYTIATDNYALALVLDELFKIINWSGHSAEKLDAKEKIARLKGQILPYLVSQSVKQSGKATFLPNAVPLPASTSLSDTSLPMAMPLPKAMSLPKAMPLPSVVNRTAKAPKNKNA